MSFTSLDFLVFFLIVFVLYWLVRDHRPQNLLLLLASYVFYGWVHPWYILMLGASTLADYFIARGIASSPERKRGGLALSLALNLGVLGFFKYYNFFGPSLANSLNALGWEADIFLLQVALPAGLSFYTLKKLSYLLDVSSGTLRPAHSLVDFALYVSFFPQIVAGPIDRPQKLLPQIEAPRGWKPELFYHAWPLLVMGFFKKLVVADSVKGIVDQVFSLNQPSSLLLLAASLGFTLQILADFSAYTDLARGTALLLGFETSENFRQPYLSLTPTDFWNRWHITLSTWLRDYIFFPTRRALLRSRFRLPEIWMISIPPLLTMFVSGLWHGAGWTYVVWGVYYGVLILAYQWIGIRGDWKPASPWRRWLAWVIMFAFIVFGWAIFRAPSLTWLGQIIFHGDFIKTQADLVVALITFSITFFYTLPLLIKWRLDRMPERAWLQAGYLAIAAVVIVIYLNSSSPDFIYFQF